MEDYEKDYDEFWKSIIEPKGQFDFIQVKKELHDYHVVTSNVSKVYDSITNGRISKPNTLASAVIAVVEDIQNEEINEIQKDIRREENNKCS
jgi:hypothetical protein